MIINEDYFDDIEIKDDDIVNEPDDIINSEEDISSYKHILEIDYTTLYSYDNYIYQLKKFIRIAEAVIENTQLFNKSVIRVSIKKYNSHKTLIDIINSGNITSDNCESEMQKYMKKTKCLLSIDLKFFFKPPVINFKKFCDDMYIMYVRLLKNYKTEHMEMYNTDTHRQQYYHYDIKFIELCKMKNVYELVYDIDIYHHSNVDYSGLDDEHKYNNRYGCSGKMPYIVNLIKLAQKPDLFKEYTLDIKGYLIHTQEREICLGLIPKSDEYNKSGLMLDFIYKKIICRFTSYDYSEFEHGHDSVKIWVLMDFDNTEPTISTYLKGKNAYYDGYYDYGNTRVSVRLINNDWRMIDDNQRLMPYHALIDSDIKSMESRFERDMNINS